MTEPQVWTLIGVFAAIMLGGLTLSTTLLMNVIRAGFRGVDARFEAVDSRFEAVDARFESIETKFDAKFEIVNVKLEQLDRDMTAVHRRIFGIDRADD